MLPPFAREFTKSQRDQINKAYQTGSRLVIRPTRKQIDGGFLGTLASWNSNGDKFGIQDVWLWIARRGGSSS